MSAGVTEARLFTRSLCAFTRTELLLTLAGLAILAVIFLPALARSRARSSRIGCAQCLKQTELALRTWAIDNDDHFPMQVSVTNGGTMELTASGLVFPHFQVVSNELGTPRVLFCPNDENRTYATNFTSDFSDKHISYFLNVDSVPGDSAGLLCGDRNLTNQRAAGSRFVIVSNGTAIAWTKEIHSKQGHLAFGDGQLHGVPNGDARSIIRMPNGNTNRLAVP